MDVQRIWDHSDYNAFTDLIRYQGRWLCALREGQAHAGDNGVIRIIESDNGDHWRSAALIELPNLDLRDPKLTQMPDGRLQLNTFAVDAVGKTIPAYSQTYFSNNGRDWQGPYQIGDAGRWIWRTCWHQGQGYGFGYGGNPDRVIRLYQTADGQHYLAHPAQLDIPNGPSEFAFAFEDDGTCLCLLRRDNLHTFGNDNGLFGISRPPYTDWQWLDCGHRIGGPAMIQLPDGRLVAAVRKYEFNAQNQFVREWLEICWVDRHSGRLDTIETLPSGYDCSYAGMVWHEDQLWISYYSSHEEKPCIYLARGTLPSQ